MQEALGAELVIWIPGILIQKRGDDPLIIGLESVHLEDLQLVAHFLSQLDDLTVLPPDNIGIDGHGLSAVISAMLLDLSDRFYFSAISKHLSYNKKF